MIPKVYDDFIVVEGGMKKVSTLTPSVDHVVEFRTNRLLDIRDVGIEVIPLLNVKLSDGTDVCIFSHDYTVNTLEVYPVDFHKEDELYRLDPYTVGALLMYGDYTDEYVNLPNYFTYVISYLLNRNGWELGEKLGTGGKVYFSYKYSYSELVRWVDFFHNQKCRLMDGCEPVFPMEYATGTLRTRRQLLSGIFDVGFTSEPFYNRLQIQSPYEDRIMAVRDILRSMGITSRISLYNDLYILTVTGEYDNTTGLLYKIQWIEKMVENNDWNVYRDHERLHIDSVITEFESAVYVPYFADGLPHAYIDQNFLMRRTLPMSS